MKNILFLVFILLLGVDAYAQRTSLKGSITDHNENRIKGVEIYINKEQIKELTNSRGKYSFKHPDKFKLITVYTPQHGFIKREYNGEKKIDFVFPDESKPMKRDDFKALGYSAPVFIKEREKKFYENYGSILEILNHSFPEVKVKGEQILISRRGINTALVENPLILVNDIPTNISTLETIPTTEVKSIKVISDGSEAAIYGRRGMNGVIIVQLKSN